MTDKERKSCINTINLLRRLAFNIHGVMDVIDAENCDKIISMLEQEPRTVSIPEGATNGDVVQIMFNKMFPKTIILYKNDESELTVSLICSREWWEMPYKESEG